MYTIRVFQRQHERQKGQVVRMERDPSLAPEQQPVGLTSTYGLIAWV